MGRSFFLQSAVAAGCVVVCGGTVAADVAGVPMGPFKAYPSLGLSLQSDDNVYLNNANKKSATSEVVSPEVKLVAQKRDDVYSLTYRADLGRYNKGQSTNNYNDQRLTGEADVVASTRFAFKLRPEYKLGHDPIGTTYGAAVPTPNKWRSTGVSGVIDYGAEGAKGKIEVAADYMATKYLNNRNLTVAYDKSVSDLGGTFFYRVMPRTSLLLEAKEMRISYDNYASLVPSSRQRYYLFGAKWEATAKTTGDFRIGQISKKFNTGAIPSFTQLGWSGTVAWNAKPYSAVTLNLSRQPQETTLPGSNFVLVTSSTADWAYDWNSRLTSHVHGNRYTEDFKGLGLNTLNNSYGVSIDYKMRRWLTANLGWTTWSKSVNLPVTYNTFIYDRNLVMLTLVGAL